MSDQRDQLPNDGSESVDEDMLFVVEDVDDSSSSRSGRGSAAPRAPARPRGETTASTRAPTGESRVIVGSLKPRNPLYGKLAKHGAWVAGLAILCLLAPYALTWIGKLRLNRLVQTASHALKKPDPAP